MEELYCDFGYNADEWSILIGPKMLIHFFPPTVAPAGVPAVRFMLKHSFLEFIICL